MTTDYRSLAIDTDRLLRHIAELGSIGAIPGTTGCARLALTDEDKAGRARWDYGWVMCYASSSNPKVKVRWTDERTNPYWPADANHRNLSRLAGRSRSGPPQRNPIRGVGVPPSQGQAAVQCQELGRRVGGSGEAADLNLGLGAPVRVAAQGQGGDPQYAHEVDSCL